MQLILSLANSLRDHPQSTYTQKPPKLDPLPPSMQSYAFVLSPLYAYLLSIYSPSPLLPLLINIHSDSSFSH